MTAEQPDNGPLSRRSFVHGALMTTVAAALVPAGLVAPLSARAHGDGATEEQPAYGRGQFLCSAAEPVSSPRPALLRRRRAQWMSRLAVAPTLPNTVTLPGHALISTSTVAGSMRWGENGAGLASADGTV